MALNEMDQQKNVNLFVKLSTEKKLVTSAVNVKGLVRNAQVINMYKNQAQLISPHDCF